MTTLKAILRLTLFLLWTLLLLPCQIIVALFSKGPSITFFPSLWHKVVCRLFAIKINVIGTPETSHPVLFVSNHVSYLDIPVIGAVVKASFVAKSEVANWPFFGPLSKISQTVFVKRASKDAFKDNNALKQTFVTGRNVILFPEGTSSNGQQVMPFKSTLFALATHDEALAENLIIQPFTIKLKSADGMDTAGQKDIYDLYAWYDDMTLAPHLWLFAHKKGAHIELHFHTPLKAADYEDRKRLTKDCEKMVASPLQTDVTLAA